MKLNNSLILIVCLLIFIIDYFFKLYCFITFVIFESITTNLFKLLINLI